MPTLDTSKLRYKLINRTSGKWQVWDSVKKFTIWDGEREHAMELWESLNGLSHTPELMARRLKEMRNFHNGWTYLAKTYDKRDALRLAEELEAMTQSPGTARGYPNVIAATLDEVRRILKVRFYVYTRAEAEDEIPL